MKEQSETEELRGLVAVARASGRRHYPRGLRQRLMDYVRRELAAGRSLRAMALELGMRPHTLSYLKQCLARPSSKGKEAVRRVAIVPDEGVRRTERLVVRGPYGVTIEGLSLEQAAELLRRLA